MSTDSPEKFAAREFGRAWVGLYNLHAGTAKSDASGSGLPPASPFPVPAAANVKAKASLPPQGEHSVANTATAIGKPDRAKLPRSASPFAPTKSLIEQASEAMKPGKPTESTITLYAPPPPPPLKRVVQAALSDMLKPFCKSCAASRQWVRVVCDHGLAWLCFLLPWCVIFWAVMYFFAILILCCEDPFGMGRVKAFMSLCNMHRTQCTAALIS